jgi:hypothetical protein
MYQHKTPSQENEIFLEPIQRRLYFPRTASQEQLLLRKPESMLSRPDLSLYENYQFQQNYIRG